jgi:hypothetical protein
LQQQLILLLRQPSKAYRVLKGLHSKPQTPSRVLPIQQQTQQDMPPLQPNSKPLMWQTQFKPPAVGPLMQYTMQYVMQYAMQQVEQYMQYMQHRGLPSRQLWRAQTRWCTQQSF